MHEINLDGVKIGGGRPFALIAGPCVIESEKHCRDMAASLRDVCRDLGIPFIFKASYDKANRSAITSFRGPGAREGKRILSRIRRELKIPVTSDIHSIEEVNLFKDTLDLIQIPAFLCRQTDIIVAAAKTERPVNVKKGQFLAPWDVRNIVDKLVSAGNRSLMITERGSVFGYNNLVVDFKGLPFIRRFGYPICFDATHSVQLPGGAGTSSGGQKEFVGHLVRAGVAVGIDALFIEVHNRPEAALSDGPNMLNLDELIPVLKNAKILDETVKSNGMID
ncbi:MAG: 3-deoxy-8-phosphooctulonate synthase [bacterium]